MSAPTALMSRKSTVSEEDLLRRRIAHTDWLQEACQDSQSVASQTIAAYLELLEDALLTVAVECHREARTGGGAQGAVASAAPAAPQPLPPAARTTGPVDVFGQSHPVIASEVVTCLHCAKKVQAGRFANHLQTCLGMGRAAARTASRRQPYPQ